MMDLIPAIDLIDGNCVRLSQGDFSQKTEYSSDPLSVAKAFEDAGVKRLHMVDLDGAKTGKPSNISVLQKVASGTNLIIDYGGGIKTDDDLKAVLDAGATMVSIGSLSVSQPKKVLEWATQYGANKILLGADVKDGFIATHGWQQTSTLSVFDYIRNYAAQGLTQFFCTDVSKDGMLGGPATDLYKEILTQFPQIQLIASGGVAGMDDIYALEQAGCTGVIVGKAFYEGRISLEDIQNYLSRHVAR